MVKSFCFGKKPLRIVWADSDETLTNNSSKIIFLGVEIVIIVS